MTVFAEDELRHIHPALRGLAVAVADLRPDPKNVNTHDQRSIETLIESYGEFGQRKPVVVRREDMIVEAGNGTLAAFKALGWKAIAAVVCDDSESVAKRFALVDNRSAQLAEFDEDLLKQMLEEIASEGGNLTSLGWTEEEIEELLAEAEEGEGAELRYDDDDRGLTPEEQLSEFEAAAFRQIVLTVGLEDHVRVVRQLDGLMKRHGLNSYTDVVLNVVGAAYGEEVEGGDSD